MDNYRIRELIEFAEQRSRDYSLPNADIAAYRDTAAALRDLMQRSQPPVVRQPEAQGVADEAIQSLLKASVALERVLPLAREYAYAEEVKAFRQALSAALAQQPEARMQLSIEATEAMVDAVRYLLVGLEQPGQTFAGIRKHCEMSGMDTSHWPAWTLGRDREHFNKSARAALIWHCMAHAALTEARNVR